MSNPTLQQTLVNPLGLGQDTPIDGGTNAMCTLLWLVLSEMRVQTKLMQQLINGEVTADDLDRLRADNLIEPSQVRLS